MQVIFSNPKTNKTAKLVEMARKVDGVVVVGTEHERDLIKQKFGLNDAQVHVFQTRNKIFHLNKPVFLDNADAFLQRMFGGKLKGITLTKPTFNRPRNDNQNPKGFRPVPLT